MSTIGSGVLGIVSGPVPGKGKAGDGNGAGGAEENGFSHAIASLHGREGQGAQKGARISISGKGEQGDDEAADPRVKVGRHDMTVPAKTHGKPQDEAQEEVSFEEKVAALLGAAASGRKVRTTEGDGKTVPVEDEERPEAKAEGAEKTDVGNLLELLGAQNAMPQAALAGAAKSISGPAHEGRGEPGVKSGGKVVASADGTAKGDASALADTDGGELPQSETDKLFRIMRADGKGRDLDLSLSGSGDRATLRDANPTGPKGEAVTVVEARRYIGLAQTSNAAAVTTAITQDPEWASSLSATSGIGHEQAATGKVVNTLKIQMNPIELGLVTATLRLHGDALIVSLQVETGEAYRQLNDDQDAIVRALRGQGFAVDQVSVQLSPVDRSANAQGGGDQQQQFSNQPQARDDGRRSGGEGSGSFAGQGGSREDNTTDNAAGLSGGQSHRPGGVYL
ncbi:hypothetical protein B5M44_13000 [Shinella sumterensis]|uniref:flagellar hook-length control protein FliK n=1 Tax=Shinella sumterensis TaxID=1967501 RepID=UPI00106E7649|nr:flagellar hook-length control protein FliK [Shinella sumterensis]MCD1265943.1 hypothetical protein [Shinella sumterensis]TFE97861.1 hypothetical protein B5M44_13000 [Shinella sumterensis]